MNFLSLLLTINNVDVIEITKYLDFIKGRVPLDVAEYGEWHHILPRAFFPEYKNVYYNKWNLVYLTPHDHFIAHYLLYNAFPKNSKMAYAFKMMFDRYKEVELSEDLLEQYALHYEQAKIIANEATRQMQSGKKQSPETIAKRVAKNTGKKRTEEQKKHMAECMKGVTRPPRTQEHKDKINEKLRLKTRTPEQRERISKGLKGIKKTKEHLAASSRARTGRLGFRNVAGKLFFLYPDDPRILSESLIQTLGRH